MQHKIEVKPLKNTKHLNIYQSGQEKYNVTTADKNMTNYETVTIPAILLSMIKSASTAVEVNTLAHAAEIIKKLHSSLEFNRERMNLLAKVQKHMRDPERTLVCDILANGQLLPDPEGKRYGFPATGKEHYELTNNNQKEEKNDTRRTTDKDGRSP